MKWNIVAFPATAGHIFFLYQMNPCLQDLNNVNMSEHAPIQQKTQNYHFCRLIFKNLNIQQMSVKFLYL